MQAAFVQTRLGAAEAPVLRFRQLEERLSAAQASVPVVLTSQESAQASVSREVQVQLRLLCVDTHMYSSGLCSVGTSRSSTCSSFPFKSRCSSSHCGVDTSSWNKGIWECGHYRCWQSELFQQEVEWKHLIWNIKNEDKFCLDRSKEKRIYSYLNYQRNEEKRFYWFLNYRRNEDKPKYLFLNYRRNEDKPKYLFLIHRRNEDSIANWYKTQMDFFKVVPPVPIQVGPHGRWENFTSSL